MFQTSSATVQLPKTTTRRGAIAFLILIERVNCDPRIPGMLAWEGKHYRPGIAIPETQLLSDYRNNAPLLLEVTEIADDSKPRRRWKLLEILWQYDKSVNGFYELARIYPPASYEEIEMRKLAARLLKQDLWRELESLDESAGRIEGYLETEIFHLGPRRRPVIESVLNRLVSRLLAESDSSVELLPISEMENSSPFVSPKIFYHLSP